MGEQAERIERRGGRRAGSGRHPVGSYKFRQDARRLTALYAGRADDALKLLGERIEKDPEAFLAAWIKVAEHGHGRPPQHLSLEHTGEGGGPIEYRVTVEGRESISAAAAGVPVRAGLLRSAS